MPKTTPLHFYKPIIKALLFFDKISKAKNRYLTFSGRKDGIGAQIHSIFSLHAYAYLRDMTYLHSPMKNIAHNDRSATWDQDWNDFFNIPKTSESAKLDIPVEDLSVKKQWFLKNNTLYRSIKAHPVVDLFPEAYAAVMPGLREAYDKSPFSKKDVYETSSDCLNVAVHIRRGDSVNHSKRASNLFKVQSKISNLKEKLKQTKVPHDIHIFSQGELDDFKMLDDLEVHFHLDTNLFVTFHSLVTADIFLMARSSLSYAAALLSHGMIVYEKFWHPGLKHWYLLIENLDLQKYVQRAN